MQTISKNRLLTFLVILLLIANAATIASFWYGRRPHPPGTPASVADFLTSSLKLTKEQEAKYLVLVKEHRQAIEPLREKLKEAKDSFFALVKQDQQPDSLISSAVKRVSNITEEIDLLTLHHFQKLRKVCNPEQQQKLDELIGQVTRMFAQPKPLGAGPPPPR